MSVGRITMIDWTSDEAMQDSFKLYLSTQKEYFPNAQAVINVKTGPLSMIFLAIYESYEEAERKRRPLSVFDFSVLICLASNHSVSCSYGRKKHLQIFHQYPMLITS